MAKKTYVLDTSACLTDSESIQKYGNNDIVLPIKVLEEIDKHKKRQDSVGINARSIIRALDGMRERGDLDKGVRLGKGKGILQVISLGKDDTFWNESFPMELDREVPDHLIIATAVQISREDPKKKVILVSNDINMRVIGNSVGLTTEDYTNDKIIENQSDLYSGLADVLVDDQFIDQFYSGEKMYLEDEQQDLLHPNQYLMLISSANDKKTAIARFRGRDYPLKRVNEPKNPISGIKAKNKEQLFALDLLMDPEIKVVSLVGKAGSGKTLIAIAAGLQQVITSMSVTELASSRKPVTLNNGIYKKLVVSRPVMPMGKDIGFLPGTMQEKMAPWLAPVQDNLKFLTGDDQTTLDQYIANGLIEMEALTYIRGRSISNAFIIIDEAQNLTSHEIKTILTRVGENTKIVLTGDVEQIDNIYINETSSGLTHAVEKLKEFSIAGHVTLRKGERSDVATIAAKVL
jgi:PhoH-like ATPase